MLFSWCGADLLVPGQSTNEKLNCIFFSHRTLKGILSKDKFPTITEMFNSSSDYSGLWQSIEKNSKKKSTLTVDIIYAD